MARRVLITAVAALLLLAASPTASMASDSPPPRTQNSDDSTLAAIADANRAVLENVARSDTPVRAGDAAATSTGSTTASVPVSPGRRIVIHKSQSANIGVHLPFSSTAGDATRISDGIVAYDNGNGSTTVPIVKNDASVQVITLIAHEAAPSEYTYRLDLPAGTTLNRLDDGSIVLEGGDGSVRGGIAPPWARDGRGRDIPTWYTVHGSTVTQTINHTRSSASYPIVADPFFGIDLVASVTRADTPSGDTYRVKPTTYGRIQYAAIHAKYGWPEVVGKGVPDRRGLFEQYVCHPNSQIARVKSTWNLDTWRPTVGYARTVLKACNP